MSCSSARRAVDSRVPSTARTARCSGPRADGSTWPSLVPYAVSAAQLIPRGKFAVAIGSPAGSRQSATAYSRSSCIMPVEDTR